MSPGETFCLVHGAWHDDACWELLVGELTHGGHECLTPVLPLEDPGATFEDYAAVVGDCIGDREHTVLVGHSMASAVIALVALRVPVKLLVYLCPAMAGFPPPANGPPSLRVTWVRPPVDTENRSWWPRDRAVAQLYGRIDPQLAERLAGRLRPQPQAVFSAPYPLERPPERPSAFLYAREASCSTTAGRGGSPARCWASTRWSCQVDTSRCWSIPRSSRRCSRRSAARAFEALPAS